MMRKYQVRFGGGLTEKGSHDYLAGFLPNYTPLENSVVCELTIRLPDGSTVTKCDAGGYAGMADQGDDDKSGFSDSFKRAAAKFGVARYLYRDGVPSFGRDRTAAAGPSANPAAPAEATHEPAPAPPDENRFGGNVPKSGRALFAWAKEQEQRYEVELLKYLNSWAKLQDFPHRMVDWSAEQVSTGYAEACRKLQAVPASRAEAYEEALAN